MKSRSTLNDILRVHIKLHYSWYIAFILITAIIVTQFPEIYPLWVRIIFGITAGLAFFITISFREYALYLLDYIISMPVRHSTSFVFGRLTHIDTDKVKPNQDLIMALAGLLVNMIISISLYGLFVLLVIIDEVILAGLAQWLTYIYFLLALYHFIPGYPLDTGRVLRALLWRSTRNYFLATRIASWIGWGVGLLCILGGIVYLITSGQWFVGLVLAFIGWVLHSAAVESRLNILIHEALQGFQVRDIMSTECSPVNRQITIDQLIRDCVLPTGHRFLIVAEDAQLQGAVTIKDIKRIPKDRWGSTLVNDIMTPSHKLTVVHSEQSAASSLNEMDDSGVDYMPVLDTDEVIGIISRDDLLRLSKTRAELRI